MTAGIYVQNGAKSEQILSIGIVLPHINDLAQALDGKRTGEENLTLIIQHENHAKCQSQQTVTAGVYVQNNAKSETILSKGIFLPNINDLPQLRD